LTTDDKEAVVHERVHEQMKLSMMSCTAQDVQWNTWYSFNQH